MFDLHSYQIATLKIAGTLQKSSEVMSMVNNLVKLPEISAQMQEMSKEMMKVRTWILGTKRLLSS